MPFAQMSSASERLLIDFSKKAVPTPIPTAPTSNVEKAAIFVPPEPPSDPASDGGGCVAPTVGAPPIGASAGDGAGAGSPGLGAGVAGLATGGGAALGSTSSFT